jgi:hypothetical protein
MNILIACEFSGIVRDAFSKLGHYAVSCDLLDTDSPGKHYPGDVSDILDRQWDMMIAFPPCTHLAVSGARWFPENPVGIMSTKYRKPDQIIQPWQFGHETTKATCLWLKDLPLLVPTNVVSKGARKYYPSGKSQSLLYSKTGSTSGKYRSITFQGIGDAMAEQWG